MADHDREVGPRDEEEASRGPAPSGAQSAGAEESHTMPGAAGRTAPPPPPRGDGFRDFMRQKTAQIILAGLIGLVVGGLLGGGAVAVISGFVHRGDRYVYDYYPRWQRFRDDCGPGPCSYRYPPPYVQRWQAPPPPTVTPIPKPTRTG
ncbi:hypothetical protein ACIBHX_51000 [Nonomuraea sp. NPDC050536]|uniref:hypothetical protein n=1 Tax=Nonomuraea sp. NPDC050536 TaxID=3364366 RepID=UPI0037C926C6